MTCLRVTVFVVDRRREVQSRPPLAETMFMTGKTSLMLEFLQHLDLGELAVVCHFGLDESVLGFCLCV